MFYEIYSCNFNCSFPQTWHMCNMQCRYALNILQILYTIADLHLLILVSLGSSFAYAVQEVCTNSSQMVLIVCNNFAFNKLIFLDEVCV